MNRKGNLLRMFLQFLAVSLGITFGLFLLVYGAMADKDIMLPLLICTAVGVVLIYALSCLATAAERRNIAIRAMGKDGFKVIMKDKVGRIAYKGVYAFIMGNLPLAEEHLTNALNLSDVRQNQVFCIEWLIRVHEQTGDSAKLLWSFRRAAEYSPDNPEVQSRLGHAYYVEGKLEKAKYCFEQAIHYDPNHGYSHYSLAKIEMVRGNSEKAIEILEKLTEIQENHPLIFAELAVIYAINDNEEKAKENYDKAILCGYEKPVELSARMTAIRSFNHSESFDGSDLPSDYFRYIEKEDNTADE